MLFHRFSLLYAVGFGAVGWGTFCWLKAHWASGWPSVPSTVHACEVKQSLDVDVGTMYRVHVRYSYRAHDRSYQGSRIAYGYGILLPLLVSFILWAFTRNTNQAMLERIEVQQSSRSSGF